MSGLIAVLTFVCVALAVYVFRLRRELQHLKLAYIRAGNNWPPMPDHTKTGPPPRPWTMPPPPPPLIKGSGENRTLQQLIAEQGVKPIKSINELAGIWPDEQSK